MPWMQISALVFISFMLLVSCAPEQPSIPAPTPTPKPVNTSTAVPQRSTTEPKLIDISSGGFTLAIQPGLDFEAHEDSISISDRRGEFIVSLNGRPYVASSYTLQSFLGKYLVEMASRGGSLDQGEPYEIVIDGKTGFAVDFSGSFLDHPVTGKAVAVSPGEDFIVFGLGMSLLNERENGWDESGSMIFENILDSIDFKEEVK
jgi:hypothetical protein